MVTRFAPSPTGLLHRGHAYSAWLNFTHARDAGGRFVLRIDDIDRARCRTEYEQAALDDLAWLGITWDEAPLRQSERSPVYDRHLATLRERELVYPCHADPVEVDRSGSAPHDSTPVFESVSVSAMEQRSRCAEGSGTAWRLSLAAAAAELGSSYDELTYIEDTPAGRTEHRAEPWRFGDVIVGRRDSGTTYHLSSVVDDAAQGVTHVIRGEELREVAGLHVLLARLLGFEPPVYRHHRMITDRNGQRLSKRNQAESLQSQRKKGATPEQLKKELFKED